LHQQWEGVAAIADDNNSSNGDGIVVLKGGAAINNVSSNGDGIVIVLCPECSIGLDASHASRAARWPILEALLAATAHKD
jgi:hypothetical protein